mmetsp:Transcript_17850/g.26720  ORF Transcript_17850/g.26720 Transcript_17850/m.26720 type:complete len:257 (-) Transcript_17850:24-794(-)
MEDEVGNLVRLGILVFYLFIFTNFVQRLRSHYLVLCKAVIFLVIPIGIIYNLGVILGLKEPFHTTIRKIRMSLESLLTPTTALLFTREDSYHGIGRLMTTYTFIYMYIGTQMYDVYLLWFEDFSDTEESVAIREICQLAFLLLFVSLPFLWCVLMSILYRYTETAENKNAEETSGNLSPIRKNVYSVAFLLFETVFLAGLVSAFIYQISMSSEESVESGLSRSPKITNPMTIHAVEESQAILICTIFFLASLSVLE